MEPASAWKLGSAGARAIAPVTACAQIVPACVTPGIMDMIVPMLNSTKRVFHSLAKAIARGTVLVSMVHVLVMQAGQMTIVRCRSQSNIAVVVRTIVQDTDHVQLTPRVFAILATLVKTAV